MWPGGDTKLFQNGNSTIDEKKRHDPGYGIHIQILENWSKINLFLKKIWFSMYFSIISIFCWFLLYYFGNINWCNQLVFKGCISSGIGSMFWNNFLFVKNSTISQLCDKWKIKTKHFQEDVNLALHNLESWKMA